MLILSFVLHVIDLSFPDICDGHFAIERHYQSVLPYEGTLGKKWFIALESHLVMEETEKRVLVYCVDGHVETFFVQGDRYEKLVRSFMKETRSKKSLPLVDLSYPFNIKMAN